MLSVEISGAVRSIIHTSNGIFSVTIMSETQKFDVGFLVVDVFALR
ncbi:hypothetical protein FHS15_003991 [Paenibacillus castaneae]|nr:hypothetical protein [Paenibacillus castaneae]